MGPSENGDNSFFFCIFVQFFPVLGCSIPWINLSDWYGSFNTHIGILYDILCHMPYAIKCHKLPFFDILWHMAYDIKCHKVCQYGYQKNRIDQTNRVKVFKTIYQKENLEKNQKTKKNIFPLYFLSNSFEKWFCD